MNNAQTGILLNKRFTQMQYREQLTPTPTLTPTPNTSRGRRSRSRSSSRRIVDAAVSDSNKRLLQELERKYFTQNAGSAAGSRVGGIKALRIGPGGKPVRSNRSDRDATMRADLIVNGECRRLSNSSTRQSRAADSVAGLRQRLGTSRRRNQSRGRDKGRSFDQSCEFEQNNGRYQSRVQSHSRTRDHSNGCGHSRGFQESNRLDQSRGRKRSRGRDEGCEFKQSNGRDQSRSRNQSRGRDQSIKRGQSREFEQSHGYDQSRRFGQTRGRDQSLNPFQTRGRWQQSASAGKGGGVGGRAAHHVSVKQRLGVRRGVTRAAGKRGTGGADANRGLRSQVGGVAVDYTDKRPNSDTAQMGIATATGTGWWGHKGRARGISATDSRSRSRSWRRRQWGDRRDRSSQHRSWKCIWTKSFSRSKTNNV
ncbi:hypothetical protein ACLKA7_012232 [Drosophila subpalustris]